MTQVQKNERIEYKNYKIKEKNDILTEFQFKNIKLDIDSLKHILKCFSCNLLLSDPNICSCCQTLICNSCLEISDNNFTCFKCKNINFISNKISSFDLSLINCLEINCSDCLIYSIKNNNLNIKTSFSRKDYLNHINICDNRPCICNICNEEKYLNEIEDHIEICNKLKKERSKEIYKPKIENEISKKK